MTDHFHLLHIMSAVLPFLKIDSASLLAEYFTYYQLCWIEAEDPFHEAKKQVCALAEKSVRIGWTFCDGFKNVRKRLRFPHRDYLFVTKDWPSALEYMNHVYDFADVLGFTRAVISHGEDVLKVKTLDPHGRPTSITEEIKVGYMKFQNGSRIIAFSSNPYAMAVYGGDVGLDEFAKHPNAELLWQTAQARVTWAYDLAVWSSHDGEDTLFNQFAQQARVSNPGTAGVLAGAAIIPRNGNDDFHVVPKISPQNAVGNSTLEINSPLTPSLLQDSTTPSLQSQSSPWNLYFRVTLPDAIELGLLDVINRTRETSFAPAQFIADCRSRSGSEEIFQQSYLCNPLGAATAAIVEWSAIERCRFDYEIERVHFEADQVSQRFGEFNPNSQDSRQSQIEEFLREKFPLLLNPNLSRSSRSQPSGKKPQYRLGFDVAASGQGDLAAFYIDEAKGSELWLRALLTSRTEDWHFLKTVLFFFLRQLHTIQAAGDESGLGRQVCWEAASQFPGRFLKVNFAAKKHDLGFALMNQLSVAEKRFPRAEQDIAADYFALRKIHTGARWAFNEGRNNLNQASHCDIAWAGALSTHAHTEQKSGFGACILLENGMVWHSDGHLTSLPPPKEYPT